MPTIKILYVEDEEKFTTVAKKYLERDGYFVDTAHDGETALEFFKDNEYDLIILDRMLPKVSGDEVLRYVRSISDIPVIMVTAKDSEENILEGLKMGADDYIVKPYTMKILLQRIKTVLRRVEKFSIPKSDILEVDKGRLKINFDTNSIIKDNETINLTNNEFKIVKTLYSNPNKIFTRDEIIEIAFGLDYNAYDRAIDTHIKNIRHKIEDNPKDPKYIKTIYGMGYRAGVINEP